MPGKRTSGIRFKFNAAFISMTVGPILLIAIVVGWMSYQSQLEVSIKYQHEVNHRTVTHVTGFIHSIQKNLEMALYLRDPVESSAAQHRELISYLMNYQTDGFDNMFEEMLLLNAQHEILAAFSQNSGMQTRLFDDPAKRLDAIVKISNQKIYLSPVEFTAISGEPCMIFGIPILDLRTGGLWGGLFAEFRFKKI